MALDGAQFSQVSDFYDLLYEDKDYPSEVAYVADVLARYGVHNGDILEFGSGTGRHGRLLVERGYSVFGIEQSAGMVARAVQTPGFTCSVGDICSAETSRRFSAVIALFHVMSYITDNDRVSKVFANAGRHLEAGGLFFFDVWYTPAVLSEKPEVRVKRVSTDTLDIVRLAEPEMHVNQNLVDVSYTLLVTEKSSNHTSTIYEKHTLRHYTIPELDYHAEVAGFQRVLSEEFLSRKLPGIDTWGVALLYQKV